MAAELTVLCAGQPEERDRKAGKIAEFLGLAVAYSFPGHTGDGAEREAPIAVAHWNALSRGMPSVKALFVYGWDGGPQSNEALRKLTAGAVLRATVNDKTSRISVAADSADLAVQWAGVDFEVAEGAGAVGFELGGGAPGCRVIISRDGVPFFAQLTIGATEVFLLGHSEIADLDSRVRGEFRAFEQFERLIPLMMFLRRYFGAQCWQAPAPRACFIIDDPLLARRYGCLDYQELLKSMERERYTACIAFIPWNYRRTNSRSAAFFRRHSDRYGICVHGCDHTAGEFGGAETRRLREVAAKAMWRMERHQTLSGLPFAPIMVFPQGIFSTRAMEALTGSGFLAAVNTSPFPVDGGPDCLALRELLEPAITRYSNFPLFARRYPKNTADFIMDLFVGKPLLLVEHHAYFRDGCRAAGEFGKKLNALAPDLEWTDLTTICSRACVSRVDAKHQRHIRFFTDRFVLTADAAGLQSGFLYRRASPEEGATLVTVNGRPVETEIAGGYLKISISLEPLVQAEIVVKRQYPRFESSNRRENLLDRTKTRFWRNASEFRDNVLDRNLWAGNIARRSIKWLRNPK